MMTGANEPRVEFGRSVVLGREKKSKKESQEWRAPSAARPSPEFLCHAVEFTIVSRLHLAMVLCHETYEVRRPLHGVR